MNKARVLFAVMLLGLSTFVFSNAFPSFHIPKIEQCKKCGGKKHK